MIEGAVFFINQHTALIQLQTKKISGSTLSLIHHLIDEIEQKLSEEVLECVHTYNEIAVYFHYNKSSSDYLSVIESIVEKSLKKDYKETVPEYTCIVPVCYNPEFSPDLALVAQNNNLSENEVIKRHSDRKYRVMFTGFLPGFPYLEGMDESISCPRRKEARNRIEAGSIGIAQNQTGIYPSDSPGGWQIIGKTPISLFDPFEKKPSLFKSGDQLTFKPIETKEFYAIKERVAADKYELEKKVL